jgi:hypothetical protein
MRQPERGKKEITAIQIMMAKGPRAASRRGTFRLVGGAREWGRVHAESYMHNRQATTTRREWGSAAWQDASEKNGMLSGRMDAGSGDGFGMPTLTHAHGAQQVARAQLRTYSR